MRLVSEEILSCLTSSSGIRKMFETGLELKRQYGEENVFDYSLGNPDVPPPPGVSRALAKIAAHAREPFALGYMPNAGYPAVREKLAAIVAGDQHVEVTSAHVVVTCGAAGGINVFFRTVLTPGEEVITPSPYFVEYGFYAGNAGGKLVRAPAIDFTFEPDIDKIAAAITGKTRAVILNSPHNPTGQIYTAAHYAALAHAVNAAEDRYGKPVYIVSDEPYRCLNFDGVPLPEVFRYFRHSAVIGSFSKSLSLAGERIGYIAVNPAMKEAKELVDGLIFCNRILGFVNAPTVAQKILLECADEQVDLAVYRRRRDALAAALTAAGISFTLPRGAFYFFPRSPVADETKFVRALLAERVLAVAGTSFGTPGYLRFAFCSVSEEMIRKSAPALKRAADAVRAER